MGGAGGGEGDLALGGVEAGEGGGELLGVEEALEPALKAPSSCFDNFIPATHSISRFLNRSMTTFAFKWKLPEASPS